MTAPTTPAIVLAHGAWHHPPYYRRFIDPLRAERYTVLASINASVGIDDSIPGKTWADDVRRIHETMLPYLDAGREAVVVCHAYGGIPGTASIRGLKGGEVRVLKPQSEDIFYNDLPEGDRKQYMAGLLYQSQTSLTTAVDYIAADLEIPKTYVVCTEDQGVPPAAQQAMAQAAGGHGGRARVRS
ncbi:alpha/beta-hydrolase [Xylariomycetidae sp. FL2044]|nr:alpha/beta-hydrolase [Xylariomycetidae sp. FL2044]